MTKAAASVSVFPNAWVGTTPVSDRGRASSLRLNVSAGAPVAPVRPRVVCTILCGNPRSTSHSRVRVASRSGRAVS